MYFCLPLKTFKRDKRKLNTFLKETVLLKKVFTET